MKNTYESIIKRDLIVQMLMSIIGGGLSFRLVEVESELWAISLIVCGIQFAISAYRLVFIDDNAPQPAEN